MGGPAAAGEDVGAGDDFAEAEAAEKQAGHGLREAVREGEGTEASCREAMAGEDAQAEPLRHGNAAEEGAGEFGEEQQPAALIGEGPLVQELRQNGAVRWADPPRASGRRWGSTLLSGSYALAGRCYHAHRVVRRGGNGGRWGPKMEE